MNKSFRILYLWLIPGMFLEDMRLFFLWWERKAAGWDRWGVSVYSVTKTTVAPSTGCLSCIRLLLVANGSECRKKTGSKEKKRPAAKQLCRTCWVSCWTVMGGAGLDYCLGNTLSCPLGPLRSFALQQLFQEKKTKDWKVELHWFGIQFKTSGMIPKPGFDLFRFVIRPVSLEKYWLTG